jgi:hypothetical protein
MAMGLAGNHDGAWVLCWAIIRKKQKNHAGAKAGDHHWPGHLSIWIAMGVSMGLLLPALGFSGRFNQHIFVAIVAAMLGGQWSFRHDYPVEGADCLRNGLVGGNRGCVLWLR